MSLLLDEVGITKVTDTHVNIYFFCMTLNRLYIFMCS